MVTGAAGLVGSHLSELLLARGDEVVGVDNFLTGQPANLVPLRAHAGFSFVDADVADAAAISAIGPVDAICQLASPASPPDFATLPREIMMAGTVGVMNTLAHAVKHGARYLLASTSEVYGEPLVHPQPETYWGNVNPIGPRACYDESKRFAEAAVTTYTRSFGLDGAIVRIFNTYGPRMRIEDGRAIPAFLSQALRGEDVTVFGDGSQTRSLCYVSDLVDGIFRLMMSATPDPVNIGNPHELTIRALAERIVALTGSRSKIVERPLPVDDPRVRQPDITRARTILGWEPKVPLEEGLPRTLDYFRRKLGV
jgi:dTDP-glucose 4,6-dehydratase